VEGEAKIEQVSPSLERNEAIQELPVRLEQQAKESPSIEKREDRGGYEERGPQDYGESNEPEYAQATPMGVQETGVNMETLGRQPHQRTELSIGSSINELRQNPNQGDDYTVHEQRFEKEDLTNPQSKTKRDYKLR